MTHYFQYSSRLALVLLLLSITAHSSTPAGSSLTGTVRDSGGAVVPGVEVTLTRVSECNCSDCDPEQPAPCARCCTPQRTVHTSGEGVYEFARISPGEYQLEVSAAHFKKYSARVGVGRGQNETYDVVLGVGSVTEQIQVVTAISKKCGILCSMKKALGKVF